MRSVLACTFFAIASAAGAAGGLPAGVATQAKGAGIPEEAIAFDVRRLSDGASWASSGANRSMAPASTLKLLTSLVALDMLGPVYRGRSQLLAAGDVAGGVLQGDLVLRGQGDVDLDAAAFERMLSAAWASGLREVRGDLVLDRGFFVPARSDVGVPPFDEAPEFRYNFIPDALMLNANLMQLDLVSDGKRVDVRLATPLEKVVVETRMQLVERECDDWEDGWKYPAVAQSNGVIRVTLLGDFPKNCTASTAINVIERVAFAERLFRALWTRMGGTFSGKARDGAGPETARLLAEHKSRPLSQMLQDVNKRSDNPVTRVMFLSLGAMSLTEVGDTTFQRSETVVRKWMARNAIDPEGLVLENGSGLSRKERVTPAQLSTVLRLAAVSPWAPEYMASLPIVAVDGGMRSRLRQSPAAERSRLKTGTLRDVSALAGYVTDDRGQVHVLVAMINHEKADKKAARPVLDALVDWVARASGR